MAREFAGPHEYTYQDVTYRTVVFIHDIGVNKDKKVGAFNCGFAQVCDDFDYFLGVDGDTVVDKHAVEHLEEEILSDPRIGGISAIYTVAAPTATGFTAKFLTAGQRAQFAALNMDNLLRGRNMAVLGGQCSILSMDAKKRHGGQPPVHALGQGLGSGRLAAVPADQEHRLRHENLCAGPRIGGRHGHVPGTGRAADRPGVGWDRSVRAGRSSGRNRRPVKGCNMERPRRRRCDAVARPKPRDVKVGPCAALHAPVLSHESTPVIDSGYHK